MHERSPQPATAAVDPQPPTRHWGVERVPAIRTALVAIAIGGALAESAAADGIPAMAATPVVSHELSLPTPATSDSFGGSGALIRHIWNPNQTSTGSRPHHNRQHITCEPNPQTHQRYHLVGKATLQTGETVYNKCLRDGFAPQDDKKGDCQHFPKGSKFTINILYPEDCRIIKVSKLHKRWNTHTQQQPKAHHSQEAL
jgi:hypothetical protein